MMKVCPKCGKKWPATGKFCPMDGTPLVAEAEESDTRPTRILRADEIPTAAAPLSEAGPSRAELARPAPAEPSTAPAATKPETPKHPAAAPVGPKESPEPEEDMSPTEPDRPGTFSETKWFMIGDHIKDEEIEASDLPVEDLQEIYKRTGVLPEEVRKKYSLRYGTDEDRSSGRGSGKKK